MEKKIKIFISICVVFFFLLDGSKFRNGNSYQDRLFTTKGNLDKGNFDLGGFNFKFGGNIKDIRYWNRYRLGFPLKATTIDHQVEAKIIQGRIESDALIINGILCFIFLFVLNLVYKLAKFIYGKVINRSAENT